MAEFKKINDTQVELHATPEEWDAIKTLLAYAADNYMDLELPYFTSSIGSQYFRDFSNFFSENPPPTAILEHKDANLLNITLYTCCYESKQKHIYNQSVKIVEDLGKFDFREAFFPEELKNIDNFEDLKKYIKNKQNGIE